MTNYKNASIFPTIKRDALIAFRAEHGDAKTVNHIAGLALKMPNTSASLLNTVSVEEENILTFINGVKIMDYIKTTDGELVYRDHSRLASGSGSTFEIAYTKAVDKMIGVNSPESDEPRMKDGDAKVSVISVQACNLVIE